MNSLRQRSQFNPKSTVVTALHFWVKHHFNGKAEKAIPEWSSEKTRRPGMVVISERHFVSIFKNFLVWNPALLIPTTGFFQWVQKVSPRPKLPRLKAHIVYIW